LTMVLWAVKWRLVLRHTKVSFKSVLTVSFAGYLANNLTPVYMMGGEPLMAYLLPKVDRHINVEKSAASVIVNTFLTVFPVFGLILLAVVLGFRYDIPLQLSAVLFVAGCVVALVFFAVLLLFFKQEYSRKLITFTIGLAKRMPVAFLREHALDAEERVEGVIAGFNKAMRKTMTDKGILVSGISISTLIWAVYVGQTYVIFRMLGVEVPLETILIVKVVSLVTSFISITPGAIGIFEGLTTWLFSLYRIASSTALAAVLIERLFSFWIGNLIGFLAIAYLGAGYLLKKAV